MRECGIGAAEKQTDLLIADAIHGGTNSVWHYGQKILVNFEYHFAVFLPAPLESPDNAWGIHTKNTRQISAIKKIPEKGNNLSARI